MQPIDVILFCRSIFMRDEQPLHAHRARIFSTAYAKAHRQENKVGEWREAHTYTYTQTGCLCRVPCRALRFLHRMLRWRAEAMFCLFDQSLNTHTQIHTQGAYAGYKCRALRFLHRMSRWRAEVMFCLFDQSLRGSSFVWEGRPVCFLAG
jgi:hypothetical protein